jgi:hypothetical protein
MMYIPAYWWHATLNFAPSFGIAGTSNVCGYEGEEYEGMCNTKALSWLKHEDGVVALTKKVQGVFDAAYSSYSKKPYEWDDKSKGYVRAAWDAKSTSYVEKAVKSHPQNTFLIDLLIKSYAMSDSTLEKAREWEQKLRALDPYNFGSANHLEEEYPHALWQRTEL